MPQSKGTATWLTNVRQDAPLERVRLDNSRARIENKRIDHEHHQKVETIWMKHHRNKADMKYELKRAREEADRWRRMRAQLEKNRVRSAVDSRRKDRQVLKQQAEEANYAIIGPDGEILHRNTSESSAKGPKTFGNRKHSGIEVFNSNPSGFKRMDSHISEGDKRPVTVVTHRKSVVFSSDEDDDSDDNDTDDDDNDGVFNPHHRPSLKSASSETVPGIHGRSRSSSTVVPFLRRKSSSRSSVVSSEHDAQDHASGNPGRSFQELKDLTHIDKITDSQKVSKRAELLKLRETRQAEERAKLEQRIQSFYVDVETLKRRLTPAPKETGKLKPLRIASWS